MSKTVLAKVTLGKFCIVGQTVEYMDEGDPGFGATTDIILKNADGKLIGIGKEVFEEKFTFDLNAEIKNLGATGQSPVTGPNDVPDDEPEESGIPGEHVGDDEEPVLEEDEDAPPVEEQEAQL